MAAYVPPGWPSGVHPPGSEDFERTAQAWLLDTVPPDYRLHGVLRRYPLALAAMAAHHAKACVAGAREGYRTARTELGGALPPHALDAVLAAYRAEGRRLVATAQAVNLVARALRGEVFSPQLQEGSPPDPRGRAAQAGPPGTGARYPGSGGTEDRSGAGRTAPGMRTADPPSARPTPESPGAAGDQLSARRTAAATGSTEGQGRAQRTAAATATTEGQGSPQRTAAATGTTGDQAGAKRTATAPGTAEDQLSAKRKEAAPGTGADELSAKRKAAGRGTESAGERPARDGTQKARKAPAAQRPARGGDAGRRKARPSGKQAAAG